MPDLVETKVRCDEPSAVRARLVGTGGVLLREVDQHDTYFSVPTGWLKLRVSDGAGQLVAYHRGPDRVCHYATLAAADRVAASETLGAVLGVLVDVRKHREEWTWGATVVHLDAVAGLGAFVELETPVAPGARRSHRHCRAVLGLDDARDIPCSYADLLR